MAKKIPGTTFEENKKYSDLQASIALLKKKKGTDPQLDAELKRREAAAKKFQALYAAAVEKGYTRNLSTSTYAELMQYVDSKNPSAKAGLDAYYEKEGKRPMTPAEKKATALGITTGVVGLLAGLDFAIKGISGVSFLAAAGGAIPGIVAGIGTGIANMFMFSPVAAGFLTAAALAVPFIIKHRKKIFPRLQEKLAAKNKMKKLDKEATANEKAFNSLMANAGGLDPETINNMTILTPEQKRQLLAERNKKDAAGKSKVDKHRELVEENEKLKEIAADYEKDGIDATNAVEAHRAHKYAKEYKDFATENKDFILSNEDKTKYDKAVATKQDAEQTNADGKFLGETDTSKKKIDIAQAKIAGLNELNTGKDFLGSTDDSKKKIDIAQAKAEEAARVESGNIKSNLELAEIELAAKQADEAAKKEAYERAPLSSADRATKRTNYLDAKHEREKAEQKVKIYKDAQTYVTDYTKANDYVSNYNEAVSTVNDEKYKKNYANYTPIEVNGVSKTLHEHLAEGPQGQDKGEWIRGILRGVQAAGMDMGTARKYIDSYLTHETAVSAVENEHNTFFENDDETRKISIGASDSEMDGIINDCKKEKEASLALCMSSNLSGPADKTDKVLDTLSKMTPEQIEELAKQHAAESSMGG